MNLGDEAISVGLIDCRASLAMTKKEGLAMTREVIADITNIQSITHLSELGQGNDRTLRAQAAKEKGSGGVSKLR